MSLFDQIFGPGVFTDTREEARKLAEKAKRVGKAEAITEIVRRGECTVRVKDKLYTIRATEVTGKR